MIHRKGRSTAWTFDIPLALSSHRAVVRMRCANLGSCQYDGALWIVECSTRSGERRQHSNEMYCERVFSVVLMIAAASIVLDRTRQNRLVRS